MTRRLTSLLLTGLLILAASAGTTYAAVGFQIVKDPWSIAETVSGFGKTVAELKEVHDKVHKHFKYAQWRDIWQNPLEIEDARSRIASIKVRVRQEVGWGTGGVFDEKLPNTQRALDDLQDVAEEGDEGKAFALRENLYEIYGDPTAGSVDRGMRNAAAATLQVGRANKAIEENLRNAAATKELLLNCTDCTQSDKDRLTTELNYYMTMASQYTAQSSNYQALLQSDVVGMHAERINKENQNRWSERDNAKALLGTVRVGVGAIGSRSRQD